MPLLCPRCGARNEDGSQACAYCGMTLAGVYAPSAVAAGASQAQAAAPLGVEEQDPVEAAAQQPEAAPGVQQAPMQQPAAQPTGATEEVQPAAAQAPEVVPVEAPQAGTVPDEEHPFADLEEPQVAQPVPQYAQPVQPAAYPGAGYPVQMGYGYPAWQEGVGYLPPMGMGMGYGFMPQMSPYAAYGAFPQYGYMPPMPWFGAYTPYGMPFYPPFQPPPPYGGGYAAAPYPGAAPYPQPYPMQQHRRMKTVYIVLIVIGVLLLIGGAVTAAVLLTGNSTSSFKLGDGSVTGADIDFSNLTIKQAGSAVTLTGTYSNNTKREGKVYVTVEAVSKGSQQLLSFTIPVTTGKGHAFTSKKTTTITLSGATLGALIWQGSSSSSNSSSEYPWDSSTPTTPKSSPSTSPTRETSPYSTTPYDTPDSEENVTSPY
jgi:hypothetical protein